MEYLAVIGVFVILVAEGLTRDDKFTEKCKPKGILLIYNNHAWRLEK